MKAASFSEPGRPEAVSAPGKSCSCCGRQSPAPPPAEDIRDQRAEGEDRGLLLSQGCVQMSELQRPREASQSWNGSCLRSVPQREEASPPVRSPASQETNAAEVKGHRNHLRLLRKHQSENLERKRKQSKKTSILHMNNMGICTILQKKYVQVCVCVC